MSYRSILVNLDIDRPVKPITNAATDLAVQVGARLIGLCAAQVFRMRRPRPMDFSVAAI
ncbi:hypothetical protein [Shinella sp.]|uniref:hypothetical protein n=1 Tax=Shinella sp. TaxID=1870904 RepID=UPI003F6EEFF5